MCSCLYSVCLIYRVLKKTFSINTLDWLLPNIAYAMWKKILRNLKYVHCLLSPIGKGMIYGPNGKGIVAAMEYTPMVYSPNGKEMVYGRLFFRRGNDPSKRLHKRCNVNKN